MMDTMTRMACQFISNYTRLFALITTETSSSQRHTVEMYASAIIG